MIITLPEFNPVLIKIGFFSIRYYSLAYIIGVFACLFFIKFQNKKLNFMPNLALDNWLNWAIISIIIGGRLGYVCFYNFSHFLQNPLEIFMIWQGGMSFHGGLIGVIFGMYLFCKKYQIKFFQLTDILAVATPIGLFFGRIANFINMELYGRVVDGFLAGKFGFIFPNVDNLPRHPSQLYEAFFEGIILFCIAFFCYYKTNLSKIENFREPDIQIGKIAQIFTMGQILSLPIIFAGFIVLFLSKNLPQKTLKNNSNSPQ